MVGVVAALVSMVLVADTLVSTTSGDTKTSSDDGIFEQFEGLDSFKPGTLLLG